jgi:hypothetical protein
MEIIEVSAGEYDRELTHPLHVFNSGLFNNLNHKKADEVFYLLFKEGKFRLGLVGGIKDNEFLSPFSAPFGGFSFFSQDVRLQYLEVAIDLLKSWAREKNLTSIKISLPPFIYDNSFISKQINCIWRQGFIISEINLNYSFNLDSFNNDYLNNIWYNARKNLMVSMKSSLHFKICLGPEEKELAYEIICKNRESRGYPLRMTWEQVSDTIQIIPADFFLVEDQSGLNIASAMVFHVSKSVVQVVYWGDLHGHSEKKPMNFISFKLFEFYKSKGYQFIDIGPSSENSLPKYGLCEFKESIGSRIDPKYSLTYYSE